MELADLEWERLANVVGPIWATLYAAGVCGELLARSPRIDPDGEGADPDAEALTASGEADMEQSAHTLLGSMRDLVEVVKQHIATLGSYAVAADDDADAVDPEVDSDDDWHWIKVGTNPVYVAIADGRVEAVVYEAGVELGTDDDGERVVTTLARRRAR